MLKINVLLFGLLLLCVQIYAHRNGGSIILENERVSVTFEANTGALIGLTDKESGWDIMSREVLGQSFELLLPLEGSQMTATDCRYNVVKGVEQSKPVIKQNYLYLDWAKV